MADDQTLKALPVERRNARRFAIRQEVHYQVLSRIGHGESGWGKTINISSSGLLFTTNQTLPPRCLVELDIDWPPKVDGRLPMKLVAAGRVVRSGADYSAIAIKKHQFRVKGTKPEGSA